MSVYACITGQDEAEIYGAESRAVKLPCAETYPGVDGVKRVLCHIHIVDKAGNVAVDPYIKTIWTLSVGL